jgi:hypothetical protein
MADASKLKRFGAPPPSIDEAREDLIPEPPAAEAVPEMQVQSPVNAGPIIPARQPTVAQPEPEPEAEDYERVDGRTLRKTGRTIPFSTRLNADTDKLIRRIAGKHGILIAEVVERGALLLKQELDKKQ